MRNLIFYVTLYATMGLCAMGSAYGSDFDQALFDKGKAVYDQYCMACHNYGPPPTHAPPMFGISNHYHQAFPERDQAMAHMIDFIKQPSPDKSKMMPMATQMWGMMPPLPLPDEELQAVAYWTWEIVNQDTPPAPK
ncbi:MAG: cytochrome c [Gammaproteobacteria bacterium]|nr:cytochrome c [Gammaproteobacteria bacterium]MCP5458084.1 cytochrome c [Gammaproteobacteria bacterium]